MSRSGGSFRHFPHLLLFLTFLSLLPCLRREFILLYDFGEDLSHHFSRLIFQCFDVLCSDSVAVWGFAF